MIFTNSFFANNRDLSSQIDYVICLADSIHANVLHWSSIKCKRLTRSVLAAKLFAMIHDFDVVLMLKAIFTKMLNVVVSLILETSSKSLYDCLVRLKTTIKKRLMMNVMTVRQCYEWHEIIEMKWVHEINNSFDSMTKIKSLSTLKTLIDINQINLDIIKWVERRAIKEMINQMTKKND